MSEALSGQVALITGASRGIGRSLAVALAGRGMSVGLVARREADLVDVARACEEAGAWALAVPADVTDGSRLRGVVESVERDLGPIDLLVNNAGRIDPTEVPLWETDPDAWWGVVEANVRGPYLTCQAVLPGMTERGRGRVININSGMGGRAVPTYSAYSVSKAALGRLTDCLAGPLAEHGVSVFDVSPGLVRTDMTASMPMWEGVPDEAWTSVERVVDMVTHLAAGRADELTGRFVHAGRDDPEELFAATGEIRSRDARALRWMPYGDGDPLAG